MRVKITDQALENKEITLEHLNTFDMVADILTKPLGPTDFHRLRRVLLGMDPLKIPQEYVRDSKLYCYCCFCCDGFDGSPDDWTFFLADEVC